MILIIREPATREQLAQMSEIAGETLIKLAVDVERRILAGGGELHADCEAVLLEDGSQQSDVWGADRQALRERFVQLDWPQQLGNLASTMARISTRAVSPQHDKLVADLLREAALFIEWSAPKVPPPLLLDLAPLQRELLAWHRLWPQDSLRPLLSLQARHVSDRLLRQAGLA